MSRWAAAISLLMGSSLLISARSLAQTPPLPAPSPSTNTPSSPPSWEEQSRRLQALESRLQELERANQRLTERNERLESLYESLRPPAPGAPPVPSSSPPVAAGSLATPLPNLPERRDPGVQKPQTETDPSKMGQGEFRLSDKIKAEASFRDGLFLWLDSPENDFTMHVGGWMQYDNVFWWQSPELMEPVGSRPGHAQGVASGAPAGGIGNLQDGTYFRRIRPFVEGTAWGVFEYRLIPALENNQFNTTGLDEFWVAMKNLPVVGTIRAGHVKNPLGLEGDMTSSSRCMTFMERSAYSETIERNENFVTGLWFNQTYLNDRMTTEFAVARMDQGSSSGVYFGDGQYGLQGRLTGLPIFEDEGQQLMHLAISGGWRTGANNLAVSPLKTVQLRGRPELRDDVPASSPAQSQIVPNADSNRLLDTGPIAQTGGQFLTGLEFMYILGPFSAQAEYGWTWVDNAIGIAPSGFKLNPAIVPPQNYMFSGGYVQLAYTLTGEHRAYDKRLGTLAREYYGKRGPFHNAWLTRGPNGERIFGTGAWEIAARYSYVNLNDGIGLNRIAGGELDGFSLALNWYLNTNVNLMIDWVYDRRSNLAPGTFPGYTSGFGTELQFQF